MVGLWFDGYGLSVFASEKMLTQRPETVKKFLRAYMKANAMAIADPKAAAGLKAMVPEVDAGVAAQSSPRRCRSWSMPSRRPTAQARSTRRCWRRPGSGPPKPRTAARQARSGKGGRPFVLAKVTRAAPARAGRGARR